MKHRRSYASTLAGMSLAGALVLTACTGGGGATPSGSSEYVDGGTFTFTLSADPGALDPQLSAGSMLYRLTQFAYDSLVSIDADGEIRSQLAKEWSVEGTTVTLTLNDGITCSDGSPFTAETAAANISWIADPENQSQFLGAYLPAGVTAEAAGDTVTLTLAAPSPFVLQGLAGLPMVCDSGLSDRSQLATATNGTGPYVLTDLAPNDRYTYELNEDYAWGPDGATAAEKGLPSTVVARVVPNETTAANLVLSGEINAAVAVTGPDAQRLEAAGLFSREEEALLGEQWYNQGDGHVTADPVVRLALTQAVDREEMQKVLTSGRGKASTALAVISPAVCTYDAVSGSTPATDVEGAKELLDDAGWNPGADGIREKDGQRLSLTFYYGSELGTGGSAAAELAVQAWQEIGVEIEPIQQDESTFLGVLFGTGAWDISWVQVNVSSPDQVVGFLSGDVPPEGNNFSHIENDDYDAAVAEAAALDGSAGCASWQKAEEALYEAADVVLFGNNVVKTFGNGAEFEMIGNIVPTSIRMVAG